MISLQSKYSTAYGQYIPKLQKLIQDMNIELDINGFILLQNNLPCFKLLIEQEQLKIQSYNSSAQSWVDLIAMNKQSTRQFIFNTDRLTIHNQQNYTLDCNLNQKSLIIQNNYNNSNQLELTTQQLNVFNKQIIGLQQSLNPTSAVSLEQANELLDQKSYLQIDSQTQQSQILNDQDILVIFEPTQTQFNTDLNMSTHKIINLAAPTSQNDACNKQYVDNLMSQQGPIPPLNQINAPTGDVNLNNYKIINLQTPTANQDATTKNYVDDGLSSKYTNTTTLNNITLATSDVNINGNKIINLAEPTALSDSTTKNYVDNGLATKYANTTTLNNVAIATGSVNVNNNKVTNLADATLSTDALNRQTGDSRYYLNGTALNDLTIATGPVNINNNRIINLAEPINGGDSATKNYVDTNLANKYSNTVTLDQIVAPVASLNLNAQKIIGLDEPVVNSDAATKQYVDTHYANAGGVVYTSNIQSNNPLNMGNYQINNISDGTSSQDAVSLQQMQTSISNAYQLINSNGTLFIDGNGYIHLQFAGTDILIMYPYYIDMQGRNISNLADPSNSQDAVTLSYFNSHNGGTPGPQGPQGNDGPQGPQGPSGGITNLSQLYIDTNLNLQNSYRVVSCQDPYDSQDVVTLGYFNSHNGGTQGPQGPPGNDGAPGAPGASNLSQLYIDTNLNLQNSYRIVNSVDPSDPQDLVTLSYFNSHGSSGGTVYTSQIQGNQYLNMSGYQISNVGDPQSSQDVVTLNYFNQYNGGGGSGTIYTSQIQGNQYLNMSGYQISNVGDPSSSQDVVTLNYFNQYNNGTQGPQGNDGPQGPQGNDGAPGASNLSQLYIDSNLNLQNSYKVINSIDPTDSQDLVTLSYFNSHNLDGTVYTGQIQGNANLDVGNYQISNIADGTQAQDAVTVNQLNNHTKISEFYALMPSDNSSAISPGQSVSFPQNGENNYNITRQSDYQFSIPDVGIYLVTFQVSVNEPGQLVVGLDSGSGVVEIQKSVVGCVTGPTQLNGNVVLSIQNPNTILTVMNPSGNSSQLTIPTNAGGSSAVSANLIILKI